MYPPHHFGGYELVWQLRRRAPARARPRGPRAHDRHATPAPREPDAAGRAPRAALAPARRRSSSSSARRATVALARHNHRVLDRHLDELRPDVVALVVDGRADADAARERAPPRHPGRRVRARRLARLRALGRPVAAHVPRPRAPRLAPLAERVVRHPGARRLRRRGHATCSSASARGGTRSSQRLAARRHRRRALRASTPTSSTRRRRSDWGWRLLYVGRLDPRKGVDTAVEALAHLPDEARLELVGGWDTREEERLRELARELGVERAGALRRASATAREIVAAYDARRRGRLPRALGGALGPRAARGDGARAPGRRHGPRRLGGVPARRRELPAVRGGRRRGARAARCGGSRRTPELRGRLRDGGLETAPRHTEHVFNDAVERALLAAACGSLTAMAPQLVRKVGAAAFAACRSRSATTAARS